VTAIASSWKREPFVTGRKIPYRAIFSDLEFSVLRKGLVPAAMEDKWFIYYDEPYLFFHRSWTGLAVYRVTLSQKDGGASTEEALCAFPVEDLQPAYEAALLNFLVSNLLLGKHVPFPKHGDIEEQVPGIYQQMISGTGYREAPFQTLKETPTLKTLSVWWEFWK
jgi:hypothetical protein